MADYSHFKKGPEAGLSHDIIYSLCQDLSGVIWIGTNGGGINKYVDWKNQYVFYVDDPDDPFSIPPGKPITALEDSHGYIWFGVQGKGVSRLNPETGLFKNYTYNAADKTSLSNPLVNALFQDSFGNFWIGTNDGLNRYIEETDSFERIYAGKSGTSLPENLVYAIAEDKKGNLWLGSYTRGLSVKSLETGEYRYYENIPNDTSSLSDNLIRAIYVDSRGNVWISTNKGLNRYEEESDTFRRYLHNIDDRTSISSNDVRRLFEDSDGDLWISTNGGGVNRYIREEDNFTLLSTDEGLLNNSVMGIEEISGKRLIFITLSGISVYNKSDNSFTVIDEKTGLLSSELTSAYLKTSDGSLYIGSLNGITHIPSIENTKIDYIPKVTINSFSILGIPYDKGDTPVWALKEVDLDHQENTLSFEFSVSDYSSEGKNQFAYKMEGVDSDWVHSGVRNYARYANLSPGDYIFKVIGADSRNNWNSFGTRLAIHIKPPFWGTTFAYWTYFLLFIMLAFLAIFRIRRSQGETLKKIEEQKALNLELENRVRKRTAQIDEARRIAEEATKAKSLFLANMSHELRTPLNAVVGFSELLNEEDYSPEKRHIITSIKSAGKSLSTLINDLLDLSKLEAGKMSIKPTSVNLSRVLFEIRHIFDLRLKEKNLDFILHMDPEIPADIMLDETRFRQILINLIGNSVKFTDSGYIRIAVEPAGKEDENCIDMKLSVTDTGCGISEKDLEKIFDLFWQNESKDLGKPSGTGLGLSISRNLANLMNGTMYVESELGKGTTVSVLFKNLVLPSDEEKSKNAERSHRGTMSFSNVKAVIADDIADNRNLLLEIMKQFDVTGIPAHNGKEALKMIMEEKPDILFLDLQMPVMDGYTTAEELRKLDDFRDLPIVAVTASIESEIKANHFSDFITKPYSIRSIRDIMEKYLKDKLNISSGIFDIPENYEGEEQIDDRENLIVRLDDFLEEWKDLKPSGRISRLENFAERLREVSKRHNARFLIEYSETLLTEVKMFDLKGLEKNLARFPGLVGRIRS